KAIINIGVDWDRNEKTLEIARSNKNIFASLGFHPHEAREDFDFTKAKKYLEDKTKNKEVVSIGEIGLDYFRINDEYAKSIQKKLLKMQLDIAGKIGFPVVIHCRDAYGDLLEIISEEEYRKIKMVIHCFSAGEKYLERFLDFPNLMVSFTGNITFVKDEDELTKAVKKAPLERAMVETDCPFLAPVPYRGKRNEPEFVKKIIERIAEVKRMPTGKIENQTDQNAIAFFGLR
ncbi:MAG: TatD family hydrolase, partial [Candidatus Moraniibacteriota bacterium]